MRLRQVRHHIELTQIHDGSGPALLFVHELYGSAADAQVVADAWPGPLWALDLPGHGQSDWLEGGSYLAEHLAASVDIALQKIGTAVLLGAGLGSYLVLLVAGARSQQVPAAGLLPGVGLAGAGAEPDITQPLRRISDVAHEQSGRGHDPLVASLDLLLRPPDYAARFAAAANALVLLEDEEARPPWWDEVRSNPRAQTHKGSVRSLLDTLRALTQTS